MAEKINSFTETVNKLIEQTNIALEFAVKTNESLTTQDDAVIMQIENKNEITGDPSIVSYSIPSYNTMINKVNAALQTVDTFVKGEGKILLADGTYREVSTTPIPISPAKITDITAPSSFKTRNNWFFESMMFPQLLVSFDLKDKIEDEADRVSVRRIIFDNFNDDETQWFKDNIMTTTMSYYDTIVYLSENGKRYWQDDEIHDLPLFTETYTGNFLILDKRTINGKEWYYLNTLNFGVPSDQPVINNIRLAKGNQLRYNNAVYKIDDIDVSEKRVSIIAIIGIERPSVGYSFEIYSSPFSTKIIDIPVGYDECDIIFLKGINENYNLLADEWSDSISFYTNELLYNGNNSTLEDFYNEYVSDFGKQLEGQAREKFIPAFYAVKPDSPVLDANSFEVSQINTQLNAALDTDQIKNSQTQIESTKTIISSLKSTIAQQKAELVSITDVAQRDDLNKKISLNINDLAKRTIEYQSLVRSLATLAYESDAVSSSPKYRVRGFFDIPAGKKRSESTKESPQEVIQFEIGYRYLRLDNTGVDLKTYSLNDSNSGNVKKGVYSDWTIVSTPIKERLYDISLGKYVWITPSISDGETVNINQIDIPISKGEKVEIKIRSISEAGWPTNPAKSDWSTSIIKEFPANLSGSDQVANILADSIQEESNIKLEETLSATGITTHIADSVPNPNTGNGIYFKHQAVNLSYDLSEKDSTGIVTSTKTTDLQTQLANLMQYTYVTIAKPTGASHSVPSLTCTLQQLINHILEADPSIYDELDDTLNP